MNHIVLDIVFLASLSVSGLFGPNDYNECILKNMKDATGIISALNIRKACESKFPDKEKKGSSSWFGPKNYGDCILKYNKGLKEETAAIFVQRACTMKFKKPSENSETEGTENTPEEYNAPTFNFDPNYNPELP